MNSNIDRAVQVMLLTDRARVTANNRYAGPLEHAEALNRAGLLAPEPQIIRTVQDLEALDGEAVVESKGGYISSATELRLFVRPHNADRDLPAVVVASGAHVRACREALGEATP